MLLIDGHNLIPKLPGLSLRILDDEMILINYLQDYARLRRKKIEVFFDGAPSGQSGKRQYGLVKAIFVKKGRTADDAIKNRLLKMGKEAKNYSVVSSDRQVQAEARGCGAEVIRSEDFSELLLEVRFANDSSSSEETRMSDSEIETWLKIFEEGKDKR